MVTLLNKAKRHFAESDTVMDELFNASLNSSNPLILPKEKPCAKYFTTLVNSIISQQISTKAAATIFKNIDQSIKITPKNLVTVEETKLRDCGCSGRKIQYLKSLAENWNDLEPQRFTDFSDEEIIKRLTACYGIGQWTAEMFLIFAMARPDVFAIGDLGLRQQIANAYNVDRDDLQEINKITAELATYRTLASLTLWNHLDNGPIIL